MLFHWHFNIPSGLQGMLWRLGKVCLRALLT